MATTAQKAWKGKEWFTIVAPRLFSDKIVGETPSFDPNSLVGRTVETSLFELVDGAQKYYMKVKLKVVKVEGNKAITRFDGLECVRDYVLRMSQRRTRQVRIVTDVKTKDGWILRVKLINVMNRIVQSSIKTKVRKFVEELISKESKDKDLEAFLSDIVNDNLQEKIKLLGSKIYPIRMSEVRLIEGYSAPPA